VSTLTPKIQGVLAEFSGPEELKSAAHELRQAGYTQFECYSPFPISGLAKAAGEKRSRVSLVAGIAAFIGLSVGFAMQGWMNGWDYPLIVSGKPFVSFQAFVPIMFALGVLFAAFGSVLSLLVFMRWRYHFPTFQSANFPRFSDDAFFAFIEARDPKFEPQSSRKILEDAGGRNVEVLSDDPVPPEDE
jgi:hypothetical protein